jgi:hypothetical protein
MEQLLRRQMGTVGRMIVSVVEEVPSLESFVLLDGGAAEAAGGAAEPEGDGLGEAQSGAVKPEGDGLGEADGARADDGEGLPGGVS